MTSTISSWGGGLLGRLVSSIITVSLLLLSRLGGGRLGERLLLLDLSLVLDTSITSDREWLDGGLREEPDRLRTTTSSSTTEDTGAAPPREKHVYISQRTSRKPATEPKTMPTTSPGEGPVLRPEYVAGIIGFGDDVAVTVTCCLRNIEASDLSLSVWVGGRGADEGMCSARRLNADDTRDRNSGGL